MLPHAAKGVAIARGAGGRDMNVNPIALKSVEEFGNRDSGWIDHSAALHFRYQASALDLRLALVAGEGMPAALALAGSRIAHVNNDGPVAGRPLAKMAPHFGFSPLLALRSSKVSSISLTFRTSLTMGAGAGRPSSKSVVGGGAVSL